jgi:tetratricopeptide (TPR) repeat protein
MHQRRYEARLRVLAPLISIAVFFLLNFTQTLGSPPSTDPAEIRAQLNALFAASEYDSALSLIGSAMEQARARGDSTTMGRLLTARGRAQVVVGEPDDVLASLNEALRIAEAVRDTTNWMDALGFKGLLLSRMGQWQECRDLNQRRLELATRTGDRVSEAWARTGIAFVAMQQGELDSARAGYERAADLFRGENRRRDELTPLIGLGRILNMMQDVEGARACYQRAWETAVVVGDHSQEGDAINNLGTLEADFGDMALAAQYFERVYHMNLDGGDPRGTVIPATNVAMSRIHLGQYADAAAILSDAIRTCREERFDAQLYRQSLALSDVMSKKHCDEARLGLAQSLAAIDSTMAAIDVLDDALASSPVPEYEPLLGLLLSRCLRKTGRSGEALKRSLEVAEVVQRGGSSEALIETAFELSACYRAEGQAPEALRWFLRGVELEERHRQRTTGYEWREVTSTSSLVNTSRIVLEYPPERPYEMRVAALFDILQRRKARTLMERTTDRRKQPRHPEHSTMTLAELQGNVLSREEMFLDFVEGDDESYLFAVTRDSCRLVALPGGQSDLPAKVGLFCEILATPPSPHEWNANIESVMHPMNAALGKLLLGPVSDMIWAASRIIIAPDAYFSLIPFETLRLVDTAGVESPLATFTEIHYVPSAGLLGLLRNQLPPRAEAARAEKHVALMPSGGRTLRGARQEAQFLQEHFAGFDVARGANLFRSAEEPTYGILHVAAHVDANDEKPWRSGILLGNDGEPDHRIASSGQVAGGAHGGSGLRIGPDPYVRAREIAASRLAIDLVVLAGCESALGRVSSGEGVIGLTSAFISAGVPVVVAALWPVDDAATEELMELFYQELAAGKTVARALREARLEIRSRSRTHHPFYWAGFIVVGNGNLTLHLDAVSRDNRRGLEAAGALIVLAGIAFMSWRRKKLQKSLLSL